MKVRPRHVSTKSNSTRKVRGSETLGKCIEAGFVVTATFTAPVWLPSLIAYSYLKRIRSDVKRKRWVNSPDGQLASLQDHCRAQKIEDSKKLSIATRIAPRTLGVTINDDGSLCAQANSTQRQPQSKFLDRLPVEIRQKVLQELFQRLTLHAAPMAVPGGDFVLKHVLLIPCTRPTLISQEGGLRLDCGRYDICEGVQNPYRCWWHRVPFRWMEPKVKQRLSLYRQILACARTCRQMYNESLDNIFTTATITAPSVNAAAFLTTAKLSTASSFYCFEMHFHNISETELQNLLDWLKSSRIRKLKLSIIGPGLRTPRTINRQNQFRMDWPHTQESVQMQLKPLLERVDEMEIYFPIVPQDLVVDFLQDRRCSILGRSKW